MTETNNRTGGRAILLLIAGLPVTMILASTWLWYFVERGDIDIIGALGTANSGELLPEPLNIRALEFEAADGSQASLATSEPKWTLMLVNDGPTCDTDCNELLYLTRQIRIAIGRDYQRTQRLLVVDTPIETIQSSGEARVQVRVEVIVKALWQWRYCLSLNASMSTLKVWRRNGSGGGAGWAADA